MTNLQTLQAELTPVLAVRYQPIIQKELSAIAPELAEIVRLAERESAILETKKQFSTEAADRDYEAEASQLRAKATPASLDKLKQIGTLAQRRENYSHQYRALRLDAEEIHKEGAPLFREIAIKLINRLDELSEEAAAEESNVFKKWGVTPPPSIIRNHFLRAQQELARAIEFHERGFYNGTIADWLKFLTA
ncbi:MAG: hypothetical protein NTZ94_08265 [Verrucomicrobia bacterium]|nr:hypothetical protein [Verrucomicrobiota bacterium]